MKKVILFLLLLYPVLIFSQKYVDTLFTIESISNIEYGSAVDFAGNERSLFFDLSYPNNDTMPACGRPLIIFIHGGAFITGSKDDSSPARFRKDFAKRGYAVASISYRLGQFHTEKNVHCNVTNLGLDWDCMNMTDTSEWYRAYYRGIQDINGGIRYLTNHAVQYEIDPQNIFLIGESAGGYLAMGAAYIDNDSEILSDLTAEMPDAPAPNSIYEAPCIQNPVYDLDTSIASMNLKRPYLGVYKGELNLPLQKSYTIRGVANFFGGVFNNIFQTFEGDPPALYLFHQPNDLIVPFNYSKILQGLSVCASGFPFNCQSIINRPFTFGSKGIVDLIDELEMDGEIVPDYLFENSGNTANCALQIIDPSLSGHSIDNYWLRTKNVAGFFEEKITECMNTAVEISPNFVNNFTVYPNPVGQKNMLSIQGAFQGDEILSLVNIRGDVLKSLKIENSDDYLIIQLPLDNLQAGLYILSIKSQAFNFKEKVVVSN